MEYGVYGGCLLCPLYPLLKLHITRPESPVRDMTSQVTLGQISRSTRRVFGTVYLKMS